MNQHTVGCTCEGCEYHNWDSNSPEDFALEKRAREALRNWGPVDRRILFGRKEEKR